MGATVLLAELSATPAVVSPNHFGWTTSSASHKTYTQWVNRQTLQTVPGAGQEESALRCIKCTTVSNSSHRGWAHKRRPPTGINRTNLGALLLHPGVRDWNRKDMTRISAARCLVEFEEKLVDFFRGWQLPQAAFHGITSKNYLHPPDLSGEIWCDKVPLILSDCGVIRPEWGTHGVFAGHFWKVVMCRLLLNVVRECKT